MAGPMTGIRVLDLGAMIAGPMAATVLSDQGADVIKVESPGIGDVMRYLGSNSRGISAMYASCNRNKQSVVLNLGSEEVAATLESVVVLFDLSERRAVTIPDDLRAEAQKHVKADFV